MAKCYAKPVEGDIKLNAKNQLKRNEKIKILGGRNMKKRLICFGLALVLIVNCFATGEVYAKGTGEKDLKTVIDERAGLGKVSEEEYLDAVSKEFEKLSVDELNAYISLGLAKADNNTGLCATDDILPGYTEEITVAELKVLWLGAAAIAKKNGYPCAGTLVEYSVKNKKQYVEDSGTSRSGLFTKKIINTESYKDLLRGTKDGTYKLAEKHQVIHTLDEDKDLYYALHECKYTIRKSKVQYAVSVDDRFDFDPRHFETIFATAVNDWALLCQYIGVLKPVRVKIKFKTY